MIWKIKTASINLKYFKLLAGEKLWRVKPRDFQRAEKYTCTGLMPVPWWSSG